ncbi:MAG: GMC oxidoreductase [Flavobacteriales bacterium]
MPNTYDAIIIGSGFGGSMAARQLVNSGMNVLMLERGDWVKRGPENWGEKGSIDLTPFYDKSTPLKVEKGGNKKEMGLYSCVGGPSVFYGGVSFRFREEDFKPPKSIIGESGAEWPYEYDTLAPYYTEAENLLQIAGDDKDDPTAPPRDKEYPQNPGEFAQITHKIKKSADELGMNPFPLPLAINYSDKNRNTCIQCTTCDTFACAIEAKNDIPTMLLQHLNKKGLQIKSNMVAVNINVDDKNNTESVNCICKKSGKEYTFKAPKVILSASALGTPHILLNSGLDKLNPGGHCIGRYLMRHVNAIVFGLFPGKADKEDRFHKQLAILDHYFPDSNNLDKAGSLQQVPTPPEALVKNELPGFLGSILGKGVKLLTGILAIAEDSPNYKNGLTLDHSNKDQFGLPQPVVKHQYNERDKKALKFLTDKGKKIVYKSGAIAHYVHQIKTFSHAVGTVRMGKNPNTSALDENCKFRGVNGLYVVDGSFMPSSAAVNPSLTIAANALKAGEKIVEDS